MAEQTAQEKLKAKWYAATADLTMAEAKRLVRGLWQRGIAAGGYTPEEVAKIKEGLPAKLGQAEAKCAPDVRCFLESVEGPENLSEAAVFAEVAKVRSSPSGGAPAAILVGLGLLVVIRWLLPSGGAEGGG